METESKQISESMERLARSGKSVAQAFGALAVAAREAGKAAEEFRVACYPDIPSEDHPILKQMRAVAELEGKRLVLVKYPRHIPDKVFGQTYIVYDEVHSLDWLRRIVVRRRGKKMVYRNEIHLP